MQAKMDLVCIVIIVVLNHRQIAHYNDVVDAFDQIRRENRRKDGAEKEEEGEKKKKRSRDAAASRMPILAHHATVLALNAIGSLTMDVGFRLGANDRVKAFADANSVWLNIAVELTTIIRATYIQIFGI